MDKRSLEALLQFLEAVNKGNLNQPVALEDEDDPLLVRIAEELRILTENTREINEFAIALSNGDIKTPAPKRNNLIASGLKRLQSNLLHIVWKAKQVEKGNFFQQIDFAGDLSEAFNQMAAKLNIREGALKFQIEERKKLYELMLTIFDIIKNPIFILDENTMSMTYQNDTSRQLIKITPPEDLSRIFETLTSLSEQDTHEVELESAQFWYSASLSRLDLPDGASGLLVVLTDITEWKVSQQQLMQIANLDELTGALNRRAGFEAFEALTARLGENEKLFVCFIDIDGLKEVNDKYGHSEGDNLIRTLSGILNKAVRKNDIFSRYGGDEFFLVFSSCSEEIVGGIMKRIQEEAHQYNLTSKLPYKIQFSYGIQVIAGGDGISAAEALVMADELMYENKKRQKMLRRNQDIGNSSES